MLGPRNRVDAFAQNGLKLGPVAAHTDVELSRAIGKRAGNFQRAQVFAFNFTGNEVDVGQCNIGLPTGYFGKQVCRVIDIHRHDARKLLFNAQGDRSVPDQRHAQAGQRREAVNVQVARYRRDENRRQGHDGPGKKHECAPFRGVNHCGRDVHGPVLEAIQDVCPA